jgi:hypothetical protein
MKLLSPKRGAFIALVAVLAGIAGFALMQQLQKKGGASPTINFIELHMTNPNGTQSSFLKDAATVNPDLVAGREALSESLGIWMQVAVLNGDRKRFQQSYDLLKSRFLSPQKYVIWKLQPDGRSEVNTNALGDDFRIVGALLNAYELWNREEYLAIAQEIAATLRVSVRVNGYFVDYHDFLHDSSSDTLSLVYVDTLSLQAMERHGLIDPQTLAKHLDILRNMPRDGIFYPKLFAVRTGKYAFDEDINLIDQIIVAIHSEELGLRPKELIRFLKHELDDRHKLLGRYDRTTGQPTVAYESPSVYGLAILLALETNDEAWAKRLYPHMIAMRDHDTAFRGGYVFNGNTHMFDNLIPLLAETTFYSRRDK